MRNEELGEGAHMHPSDHVQLQLVGFWGGGVNLDPPPAVP